jgi:hypothetical protein
VHTLPKWLASIAVSSLLVLAVSAQENVTPKKTTRMVNTPIPAVIQAAAQSAAAQGCDASLLKHVYNPRRLQMIQPCIEVTGTIFHIKPEADGDDHIQLRVDPQFEILLNQLNKSEQADSLILEPVCQGLVTQLDAIAACRDFHSPVEVPAQGTRVRVLGRFVLDREADHGWTEIHPVTRIKPLQ